MMNWLLDTDVCSAHLRGIPAVNNRVTQYLARISVSVVTLVELHTWVDSRRASRRHVAGLTAFLDQIHVISFEVASAVVAGKLGAELRDRGITIGTPDLMIAATAMT